MAEDKRESGAPWLDDSDDWSISKEPVENVRPGMYIYQHVSQAFVLVAGCTILRNPDVVFIDSTDGKTACLSFGESVFVRQPVF